MRVTIKRRETVGFNEFSSSNEYFTFAARNSKGKV